jgi:SAM-dependent methyltransferase
MDTVNKILYERKDIVEIYACNNKKGLYPPEEMIFQTYREHIQGKIVLDIGCGTGRTTPFLEGVCKEYAGIDYSGQMIEFCKKAFGGSPNITFACCDVRDMKMFENNKFDFILFSYNGLDYTDHEGRLRGLSEIRRVLGEGGLFVFSSHNANFRKRYPHPKLKWTIRPREQAMNIIDFLRSMANRRKMGKLQYFGDDYSLINMPEYSYALLTYCLGKRAQVTQLGSVGLEVIEMRDMGGNVLDLQSDDSHEAWIHYVVRKAA